MVKSVYCIILFNIIFSIPRYSLEEATNCISCHVNPSGGGMRNDYGSNVYALDELPLKRWQSKGDEDWNGYISDHIQIGGDFRLQLFDDGFNTKIFPMQTDVYSNIEINNIANLYIKADLGLSKNEYFILFNNILNKGWLKIGKSIPTYGLKIDDHTSFTRGGNSTSIFDGIGNIGQNDADGYDEGLFFDQKYMSIPVIIEVNTKIFKNVNLNVGIANDFCTIPTLAGGDYNGIVNYTATINYIKDFNNLNILTGISLMKESPIESISFYGGLSIEKLTILFELDQVNNYFDDDLETIASMLQINYKPIQGINLLAKYDHFDRDYNVADGSLDRRTFGFSVYPLNILEFDFQIRNYYLENMNIDINLNTEYLLQIHTWF